MCRDQVLVNTRIAHLVAAEALVGRLDTPNTNLGAQFLIDFLNDVWVFDDQLQRNDIASRMHTLVRAGTADERRFLRICRICLGDCAGCDKCWEELSLDCLLLITPANCY